MHAKVFSIQIFQYFHQIPPRVCTLALFVRFSKCLYIYIYIYVNDNLSNIEHFMHESFNNSDNYSAHYLTASHFRMDKLHITNFPTHLVGCRAVHMKLQLLHGSQELCPAIKSTTKLPASEVVWEEQLEFESEIRNIPKVIWNNFY